MKRYKFFFYIMILIITLPALMSGCSQKNDSTVDSAASKSDVVNDTSAIGSATNDTSANSAASNGATAYYTLFSHSEGIDDNGYWSGIKALDYIETFNYKAMNIPYEARYISDADVQSEIDFMLSEYFSTGSANVTDRMVVDGDTINIDYVGSVDGVEFANGSTDGMGADVTIGVTTYIDDFLEQLIGHMPGDTVNVEVTFPEVYQESSLQGKDALFVTKINYIIETSHEEFTDEFVATNLAPMYGWTTVEEANEGLRTELANDAIRQYIQQYLSSEVTVRSVPDELVKYQEKSMMKSCQQYAEYYEMGVEEFLYNYEGYTSVDEFIAANYDFNVNNAGYSLTMQAVAEDAGLAVNDNDIILFFNKYFGTDDYSQYEQEYGLPYIKQLVLGEKVFDLIAENAILS